MGAPTKAVKRATGGAARKAAAAPVDPTENFYGPPQLTRARGAGTTGPDGEISLDFSSEPDEDAANVPMERLFSIDGKEYWIPAVFPAGIGVIYLDGISDGQDVALGRCLKAVIGDSGWAELVAFVKRTGGGGIKPAQMAKLLDVVLGKVLGSVEGNGGGNG